MDSSSTSKAAAAMERMKLHLATDAGKELINKVGVVFQCNISPKKLGVDEEIYTLDLKQGKVTRGPYEGKPDVVLSFTDSDFDAILMGKMNPQIAFIRGAIKLKGSLALAQKFSLDMFPKPPKL